MERRWRDRPGDHLSGGADAARERLASSLLDPEEAATISVHGKDDAAVLIAVYDWPDEPGLVLTERRHDMRRHAGEVSFPGGRSDPGESAVECALREAHEEIGLDPAVVDVVGALPPTSTVVTSYRVIPIVGLIPAGLEHTLSPREVERVIECRFEELRGAYGRRRLIRRGVPFRTATFEMEETFVWGATARMLEAFFERLDGGPLP